jgi:hypothetical protein
MLNEVLIGLLIKQIALIVDAQSKQFVNEKKIDLLTNTLINMVFAIEKLNEMELAQVDNEAIQILLTRSQLMNNTEI